jgi:hypothetical protein
VTQRMDPAPPAHARPATAARETAHAYRTWLIMGGYVVGSFLVSLRLWVHLGTTTPIGDPALPGDYALYAWFARYTAEALAHGHLPALYTTALNAPRGVNLMWNTSLLLPSVLLAPVTLLAGPLTTLTVSMTIGYAGSAAAMFWLLRRLGTTRVAAALGGALYGFSPAMVDTSIGHYSLQFLIFPPLIIGTALRLLGHRSWRTGIWLGVLVAAQLFTGEEVFADTALVVGILVVVLALSRPQEIRRIVTMIGPLAVAGVTLLAVTGYALWVQFHGPLKEHGSPFPNSNFFNTWRDFINAPGTMLFHTTASAAYAADYQSGLWEYLAYIGWPLLIVTVAATIRYWHDPRIRTAGILWAVLDIVSLGGNKAYLPFHWVQGLPLLVELFPSRLPLFADGAAAVVLAVALDLTVTRELAGWRDLARPRRFVPLAIVVLAVLPLIPRPMQVVTEPPVPAGWTATLDRLPAGSRVLVVPLPYSHKAQAQLWQAETGLPDELIGGWFLGPSSSGHAVTSYRGPTPYTHTAGLCIDDLWSGEQLTAAATASCATALRTALAYWRPAAALAVTTPGSPLGRFLTANLGAPYYRDGQVLLYHVHLTQ